MKKDKHNNNLFNDIESCSSIYVTLLQKIDEASNR
jgi:hypothetical protein